ncbi:MAG: hypothetical protein M1321_01105 [Candidatus Marsarchaeota archaeon]|jgi:mannitol-specific phosphotransferase system IIBC component|nr:hypothetical protein [Candidatus Marsarchaeota archaeon]
MAKSTRNGRSAPAFVLAFLGSLAYLYVVYELLAPKWAVPALFSGNAGGVLLPIFAGVGVVSAIGLFLLSFVLLTDSKNVVNWIYKSSVVAGITLVALTVSNPGLIWFSVLGVVLSLIGTIIAAY